MLRFILGTNRILTYLYYSAMLFCEFLVLQCLGSMGVIATQVISSTNDVTSSVRFLSYILKLEYNASNLAAFVAVLMFFDFRIFCEIMNIPRKKKKKKSARIKKNILVNWKKQIPH